MVCWPDPSEARHEKPKVATSASSVSQLLNLCDGDQSLRLLGGSWEEGPFSPGASDSCCIEEPSQSSDICSGEWVERDTWLPLLSHRTCHVGEVGGCAVKGTEEVPL